MRLPGAAFFIVAKCKAFKKRRGEMEISPRLIQYPMKNRFIDANCE